MRQLTHWYRTDRTSYWYGQLLGTILLAAEDDPIVYVTDVEESNGRALLCFTDQLLIRSGSADMKPNGTSGPVTIVPRRNLSALAVLQEQSVYSNDAFAEWPAGIAYTLTYPEFESPVLIPSERPATDEGREEVASLLPSLKRDLLAST